ncbi:hypothetical protein ABK040_000343 [Willaertia magna]
MTEPEYKSRKVGETSSLKKIQVSPQDVDKIVEAVVQKNDWKDKLDLLAEKWKKECQKQGISLASVDVAFEILRAIEHNGRGAKHCCGYCGADPKPEEPEEEDEGYDYGYTRYSRDTKFCLCPCSHCATEIKLVEDESVCAEEEDLIPKDLTERLKKCLTKFENVPEEQKDYHPSTDNQVLDLIHPSLYCYVKGVSEIVGKGVEKVEEKKEEKNNYRYYYRTPREKTFKVETQWLPTEFLLKENNEIEIQSYINNVDERKHKELYDVIGKIFSKFVPLFDRVIPLSNNKPFNPFSLFRQHLEPKKEDDSSKFPKRLQVIVKAANIIVNQEKGYYPGGSWHIEGTPNENIVAAGIYYYESTNVKDSYLEFRSCISEYYGYQQDDVKGAFDGSGLHDGDLMFDLLGSVETKEGKCIVFPNTNQHRVRHFFPIDPSKPAIRKILVFFLVDPEKPIISTKDVEPQQLPILLSKYFILVKIFPIHLLYNNILKFLPHFTLEEAKNYREELMKARKYYKDENNEDYERPFSLCEH